MNHTTLNVVATPRGLALDGRFDAHVIASVANRLAAILADARHIDLDLTDVHYLDGAALDLIDRTRDTCRRRGGDLRVVAASPSAAIIFELARLTGQSQTTVDRELAVAA